MSKPTKAQLAKREARALDLQQRKEALSTLGYPEAGGSRGAVWEGTALKITRWSRARLRRLPHTTVANPHHLSGSKSRLYDPRVLLEALGPFN